MYLYLHPSRIRGRSRLVCRCWLRWLIVLCVVPVTLLIQSCASDIARLPVDSFEVTGSHSSVPSPPAARIKVPALTDKQTVDTELGLNTRSELLGQASRLLESHRYAESAQTESTDDRENSGLSGSAPQLFNITAVKAPVESLLFSVAGDAGLQLRIFGQLSVHVTLNARQQTLDNLLDTLAEQASFSWQLDQAELIVWAGEAYGFSYPVDYLNISRRTESRVGLATQVGTINAADDGVGSIANSSETRVENSSEHEFWNSLAVDMTGLMSTIDAVNDQAVPSLAKASYSINKEAGLLTVFARPSIHRTVKRYLKMLHDSAQRQVLIEATVVEVALSDSFEAGVDWQVLASGIDGISAAQVLAGAPSLTAQGIGRLSAPAGLISLVQQGGRHDIQATLSLLEQFGDVRILSRPRIIALNNQSSVLKVVDNRVYFTVNVQRRQTDNNDEIETETEIHTVPVGLVMNVTPQISAAGFVMLNVRPTLSRILGFVNDPNPELAQANVKNGVPEIQVREMETMLQVQSGRVAVIGGLMQETRADNDAQLPGLGRLPGIGNLFRRQTRKRQQTELLIVLRPTVISYDNKVAVQ